MQDDGENIAASVAADDRQEQKALVERILATDSFTRALNVSRILAYLFRNAGRFIDGKELATKALGASDEEAALSAANNVRERCKALRNALEEYAEAAGTTEKWQCELPFGVRGEGYKLRFIQIERKPSPTELFWRPHLDAAQRVMVVCNSHLFFYDPAQNGSFRFYDTNGDGDGDEALALLQKFHPKAYKRDLQPIRFYLSSGEVNAYERLQIWFHQHAGILIPRRVSRDVHAKEILNSSPILLGRPDANKFIRRIFESPEASHLGYRFQKPLGSVKIKSPRKREIQTLSRFPLTADGVLGPVPKREVVFGIATRLPNPSGYGTVTIISADYYATVIAQITAVLTNNEQCSRLLAQMNWPADKPLPESFEMLFAVRLSPGNMEGEGHAELLAWRTPPTEC